MLGAGSARRHLALALDSVKIAMCDRKILAGRDEGCVELDNGRKNY